MLFGKTIYQEISAEHRLAISLHREKPVRWLKLKTRIFGLNFFALATRRRTIDTYNYAEAKIRYIARSAIVDENRKT